MTVRRVRKPWPDASFSGNLLTPNGTSIHCHHPTMQFYYQKRLVAMAVRRLQAAWYKPEARTDFKPIREKGRHLPCLLWNIEL